MAIREVAELVRELEREAERERHRAEVAEGKLKLFEFRDKVRSVAVAAKTDVDFQIRYEIDGKANDIQFSPGLWLLVLAEKYLEKPQSLLLEVKPIESNPEPTR